MNIKQAISKKLVQFVEFLMKKYELKDEELETRIAKIKADWRK